MIIKLSDWKEKGIRISTKKNSSGQLSELPLDDIDGIGYDLRIKGIDVKKAGASLQKIGMELISV